MDKVRVGIIGCGVISEKHFNAYNAIPNDVEIIACCDIDEERVKKVKNEWGIKYYFTKVEELLDCVQVDAVSICLPHNYHAEVAVKAAKNGKHVLCEKPIANTLEEAAEIIEAARKYKVKLMIGHSERFDSTTLKLRELINSGSIGRPFMSRVAFEYYPDMSSRMWMMNADKAGGGVLINSGIHKVDLLRYLFNREVENVAAFMSRTRLDFAVEDSVMLNLRFADNCIGQIFASFAVKRKPKIWTEQSIYGERGTIEVKREKIYVHYEGSEQPLVFFSSTGDGIQNEIKEFINCIINDKPSPVSGEDAIRTLAVVLAAYESARENKVVCLG